MIILDVAPGGSNEKICMGHVKGREENEIKRREEKRKRKS